MKFEEIAQLLPEQPRDGMVDWALSKFKYSDLGGEFLKFRRESVTIEPELKRTMTAQDYDNFKKGTRRHWGALCECTFCRESFITGYEKKDGMSGGIKIFQGEDGQLYDGYVPPEYDNYDCTVLYSGDDEACPFCNSKVKVIRDSELRDGRLYQLLVTSVERIGRYTAVVTWLLSRRLDYTHEFEPVSVIPRGAVVIGDKGRLLRFAHTETTHYKDRPLKSWEYRTSYLDPMYIKYHSYEACNSTKIGSAVWTSVPDLTGTTGEKTGLADYVLKDGCFPNIYLKTQKRFPQLENLVKSDYFNILESGINEDVTRSIEYYGYAPEKADIDFLDLNEVKPHKMLHFRKDEFKSNRFVEWDCETARCWLMHDEYIGDMSASKYDDYISLIGLDSVRAIDNENIGGENWYELDEVVRYLFKQERKHQLSPQDGVQYLIDYRDEMFRQSHGDITDEILWPQNLLQSHDRIFEQKRMREDERLQENFDRITKKYSSLRWNDGELCIRVAASNQELVDEGATLRHCVGGYGTNHCAEKDVIFFVRHYRRPERSYYTLDIRFTDGVPAEVQLHGYGNERHGENKQYTHKIPEKVRAFVDRWEKEVLMPFAAKAKRKERRNKNERKSDSTAA